MKKKEPKEKVYKAGTKITLHSSCNYAGCNEQEEHVLEVDYTESALNDWANENAIEVVQPEGWFTVEGEE